MDQDLWNRALLAHGELLLKIILSDNPRPGFGPITEEFRICRFIKTRLNLLFISVSSTGANEKPEGKIPTLPIELFRNETALERRDLFFSSLNRGNILLCKVINDTLPEHLKLLVLAKHEGCMKLDDLSLLMYLPKHAAEMKFAGGELHSNDLIRAAVWSCSVTERKIFVTLDSSALDEDDDEDNEKVPLGKISEEELPLYTRPLNVGSSYTEYLRLTPAFNDTEWENEMYSNLNLKRSRMYSFFEKWDGKIYQKDEYASELKKKRDLVISDQHYENALQEFDKGNHSEAFLYLNKALCVRPENVDALVSRGKLYTVTNNLVKAVEDVQAALKIDSTFQPARQHMSKLLVSMAKTHISNSDYSKAQESLNHALFYNPKNTDAAALLEAVYAELPTLLPSSVINLTKAAGTKVLPSISRTSESSSSKSTDSTGLFNLPLPSTSRGLPPRMKDHHHIRRKRRHHYHHRHRYSRRSRSKSPVRK